MPKKQKRSSVTDAFGMGASGARLSEHYKRSGDLWQQYSSDMVSLMSGAPDPARYMKRSLDLTLNLHRELFESCVALICGEGEHGEHGDVDDHCLTFQIDRYSESTSAKPFKLPLHCMLSSICKSDLKLQGGSAVIPAAHVHLTRRGAAPDPKKLYVSLVDLSALVTPETFPLGVYEGALTIGPGGPELLCIRVELTHTEC